MEENKSDILIQRDRGLDASFIEEQREKHWQQVAAELVKVTDRLGMGIDMGIFETVVALNVLNINTSGSCEGHLDRGSSAPWVYIAAKGTEELEKRLEEANDALAKAYDRASGQDMSIETVENLYNETERLAGELQTLQLHEIRKVIPYLEAFYNNRHVPEDRHLIIESAGYRNILESQGAKSLETAPIGARQQKQKEYQEEMWAFTAFLKEKYFI